MSYISEMESEIMYFDTKESSCHIKAKEKLFDLITSKRIRILDQNGMQYEVFTGKEKGEFLHIESFVMNYSSDVIFSNLKSPCKKLLEEYDKQPKCNLEGYYGAYKELPCENCVKSNFRKYIKGSSKFASYRPDISFGYEGKHKIWLEIKNESPCSENKIEFCKREGIILLEISDSDVLRFKEFNGDLVFNRLEEYIHKVNIYNELKLIRKTIDETIYNNKYILKHDIHMMTLPYLEEKALDLRLLAKFTKELRNEYVTISKYGRDKKVKDFLGLKKNIGDLYVSKENYNKLFNPS